MTSEPVYPEAPTCALPEHSPVLEYEQEPSSPHPLTWRGEEGARSAPDEGSQTPTCEEREIDTRGGLADGLSMRVLEAEDSSKKGSNLRTERWKALGILWDMSSLERVRKCGRVTILPGGNVGVRKKGEAVGYAGLATCGSVWACPRCSARIMAVRRLELGVLISAAAAEGYTVAFGTVTLRHKQGQALAVLWEALTKGQQGVTNATKVKRIRQSLNRVGYVRATEVTYGGNGWHPHIHTIQLFKGEVSQDQLDELRDAEFDVWSRQCQNRGLGAPLKKRYELRKVNDANVEFADYFAKGVYDPKSAKAAKSVSFEMTGSQTKKGRRKESRTPWEVLEDFGKTGDFEDWEVFEEYEKASKGKRALVWSRGLKDLFSIGEVEDEDIAAEEVGDRDDTLFWVTDWSPIAGNASLGGRLLAAVKSGGLAGGLTFCREHGIPTEVGVPGDGEE